MQKRKAQAALPSSDTEGSDDEVVQRKTAEGVQKLKRTLDRGSPSPKGTASWTIEIEGEDEDEVEEPVEERSPTRTQERKARLSKSKRSSIIRTTANSTIMAEHDAADETDLYLNVESPTSSPVLTQPHDGPSTPPRNGSRIARPLTPHESPRDLSALFAAVSPGKFPWANQDTGYEGEGSTGGSGSRQRKVPRPGGMRRMLTKTQSLGAVPDSPSEVVTPSTVCGDDVNPFDRLDPGPSTPSRSLGKTRSLPESPSKTSLTNGASLLVAAPLSSEQNDSGGRAKRTYGRSRTILAESSTTAGVAEEVAGTYAMDNALAKESYAVLRKKFEVDNTESREDESRSGNLMSVCMFPRCSVASDIVSGAAPRSSTTTCV